MIKLMFALLLSIAACPANAVQSNPVSGPTYTSDFTTGALDSRYTFTRASTAWYYNSSGILTQAAANIPRFDYNPSTLAINGLLVEGQATNLVYPSIPDGTYSTTASTISATGAVTAPDGTTVSANFVDNTSNTSHYYIAGNGATSYTSGQSYTVSVYALENSNRILQLTAQSAVNSGVKFASFDLNAKIIVADSGTSPATIQSLPGGWVRCTFTWTATSTSVSGGGVVSLVLSSNATSRLPSYAGNSTGFYVWGQQLEANNFATSPIPTTTTVATRLADNVVNSSISGWFNSSHGTMKAEFLTNASTARQVVASFNNSPSSPVFEFLLNYTGANTVTVNTFSEISNSLAISSNAIHKMSAAYAGTAYTGALDGSLFTGFTGDDLTSVIRLQIGSRNSSYYFNAWIRKFMYWNKTLTPQQQQAITQ